MTTLLSAAASANSGAITTLTMILIGIGALVAIAVIAWGTMRRRVKASEVADSEKHASMAGHAPGAAPPTPADAASTTNAAVDPVAAPVPAQAPPRVAPKTVDAPRTTDAPTGYALTVIKGLGPKAAAQLTALGVADVDQLAALTADQVASIDAQMGTFAGRIIRDRWIEQAKLLATGDIAGFEAVFGKLGG